MYTNAIHIALSYRRIPRTEIAYINYFAGSLNIYIGKTLIPNSGAPSSHLSANRKPYYNNGLSLNGSINPTSISL